MELKFTHMTEDNELVLLNDDKLLLSENNDDDLAIVENNRKNHEGADYSSYQLPGVDLFMPQDDNDYDYTEKIIPAATLKEYKQVRLYLVALEAKNQINATAKAVNSKTATDLAKKYCEQIDKIVATDYVLDVRMSNKNEWSAATRAPIKNIEELVDKAIAEIKGK